MVRVSDSKDAGRNSESSFSTEEVPSGRICWKCGETYDDSYDVCPIDGVSLVSIGTSASKVDPHLGTVFDGRYLISRKLGEGGMGIVYAAKQIDFEREVAIKILRMNYVSNRDVRRRFMYEARTISNLKHPNAVRLYDFGQSPSGDVYMVMELLVGESLADRLSNSFVSYRQIFDMLIPICGVLAEAHNNGVIHRDLKPENIYIGHIEGQPEFYKLLDFGIAKHLESKLLTQSGMLWGTPAYMSPEQIMGNPVSSATDIYAIGVMLYELISGRLPFNAETPVALAVKHLAAPVRSLRTIPGLESVPIPLDKLILSALNKEPASRPKSMELFVDLLASIRNNYFDAEMLDIVPPSLIDVQKYDQWVAEEPSVSHAAPEDSNDLYSLHKSFSKGGVEKIEIPDGCEPPSIDDILRKDHRTDTLWKIREELAGFERALKETVTGAPLGGHALLQNDSAGNASKPPFSGAVPKRAFAKTALTPVGSLTEIAANQKDGVESSGRKLPPKLLAKSSSRPINVHPTDLDPSLNNPKRRVNRAFWREIVSFFQLPRPLDLRKIHYAVAAGILLLVVLIAIFGGLQYRHWKLEKELAAHEAIAKNELELERVTRSDIERVQLLAEAYARKTVKDITDSAITYARTTQRGSNARDLAIQSAVLGGFSILQNARDIALRVAVTSEQKEQPKRSRSRRKKSRNDKARIRKIIRGTF